MAPYSDSVSLRLPYLVKLATERKSLTHYTKGTPSPLARLRLFVCMRFQDLFHSPPGVLFTFPSQYLFTIDLEYSLALDRGRPNFIPDFTCPILLTSISYRIYRLFRIRGYYPLWPTFPGNFSVIIYQYRYMSFAVICRVTPVRQRAHPWHRTGLGCSNFARHYFRNLG